MAFLKKFFAKNITEILEQFYQHAGLENINWISIAVNHNSFADSMITRELELITDSNAHHLKLALKKNGIIAQLWKNNRSEIKGTLSEGSSTIKEFNQLLDLLLERKIHLFQGKLSNLDQKIFTTQEVANEDKALEWIRVSFTMLEKAIIQSLTDPELLFQTKLFMGINPKTRQEEIRLITFNLDIKFEFLTNHLLRVRIYNDKNEGLGSAKKASLEGDFNYRKREMLDELTKVLSVLASGIKIT